MAQGNFDQLQAALPPKYRIERALGVGGQGSVFLAQNGSNRVVLKVFNPSTEPRRVTREIELLKSVNCVYLVRVLDDFSLTVGTQMVLVVVYEYLSGGDLRSYLEPNAPSLDTLTLQLIGVQMSEAIEALWSSRKGRVVHRDIKPANIVKAEANRYVLVDLALARHVDLSNVTGLGLAPGTQGYMSPEQCMGRRNLTISSDIFSLGVTLFELASKLHPFSCNQNNIQNGNKQYLLGSLRPDLPHKIVSLIERMMA